MNRVFDSQIQLGDPLPNFTQDEVKNEPMLFSCNYLAAFYLGGPMTKKFLHTLPEHWQNAKDLIVDSRVHVLMPGWFPAIPGFHGDDVPRERSDGQPNYDNPSYKAEHCMAIVGDCCPTEFAVGEAEFPDVPLGEKCYKIWHPLVVEKIKNGELRSIECPTNKLVFFNWQTWHQGTRAKKNGWRWFIRATRNTNRPLLNEVRRQVQVYLDLPMEGW